MIKKGSKKLCILIALIFLVINSSFFTIRAEEDSVESEISLLSIGENGEEILVRGTAETVADYGQAVGYETTSHLCTSFIPYRAHMHHTMTVTSASGETIGYCMQPYMLGPNSDYFEDYNYVEGLSKSHIFNSISDDEAEKWKSVYAIALKYGYGGAGADPNSSHVNTHDGGSYGTYMINENGQLRTVKGLMIGGKVYEMTQGEAMAITQVLIHHICNRGSENTITDYLGNHYPSQTSAAYKHLKAYADYGATFYDNLQSMYSVAKLYDNYQGTNPIHTWTWYYYDFKNNSWQSYTGQELKDESIGPNNEIKIKVSYYSKNLCNKLVCNTSADGISVKHSYNPFVVDSISGNASYYDYFSVDCNGKVPITVEYDRIDSCKESISHELLGNKQYDVDCFTQNATITINADELIKYGDKLPIEVRTGTGATASPSYDESNGKYCSRLYSSSSIQDCLMIASNIDTFSQSLLEVEMIATGKIELQKISDDTEITSNNPCYDMSGARYNVYSVSSDKDQSKNILVGTFVTDKNGKGEVTYSKYEDASSDSSIGTDYLKNLPIGWYMVCEEAAPTNGSFIIDDKKYYVNISKDNHREPQVVESKERPVADPIPFEIVKECAEGDNVGAATLEGAEFTVWYYKGYYENYEEIVDSGVSPDKTWIFDTRISDSTGNATCIIHQELLLEGSDEPYLNSSGNMILPLGTIVVKETKAPRGYSLDGAEYSIVNTISQERIPIDNPYVSTIKLDQGTVKLSVGNKLMVSEQPVRGDFELVKKDKYTDVPMAGVPFLITSKTTGEAHIIVTDENGIASTSSSRILHSDNPNGNDMYDEESDLEPTGIWFSGNESETEIQDEKGALPYDNYTVKELPSPANMNYSLSPEFEISITESSQLLEYGTVYNVHNPVIMTEIFDKDGDKLVTENGEACIVDKVDYSYLEVGKEYILKGQLVYKNSGECVQIDGKNLESDVEFVPEKHNGYVEVEFKFNIKDIEVDDFVAFENLYDKSTGELIASHQDLECEEQTIKIRIPKVMGESMVVESGEGPKTGDSHMIWFFVVGIIIATVGIVTIFFRVRKNR